MRVGVLGGTRFIGRAVVEELAASGHRVLVVHRGVHASEGLPEGVERVLAERGDREALGRALAGFGAEAFVDTRALTRVEAEQALAAVAPGVRLFVLSSMDVYEAYGASLRGVVTEAVPIDETSRVRTQRYPYRGLREDRHDYDKLDVEPLYVARGATVFRLPAVYGERDYQRREEFVLRRVRAGRARMPFGRGSFVWTRGYVRDVARGVRLALEADAEDVAGEVFNLGEPTTLPVRVWAEAILEAAGATMELVRVPDEALPEDLDLTGDHGQPLLFDSSKARARLAWETTDPIEAIRRSVAWHLANPPHDDGDGDFAADDAALAQAR